MTDEARESATRWLKRLAERTSVTSANLEEWGSDLAQDLPKWAFTKRSLRLAANRFTPYFPHYGEITQFLREYLKTRESERNRFGAVKGVMTEDMDTPEFRDAVVFVSNRSGLVPDICRNLLAGWITSAGKGGFDEVTRMLWQYGWKPDWLETRSQESPNYGTKIKDLVTWMNSRFAARLEARHGSHPR